MLQNAQAGTHAIREAQAQAQAYSIMIAPSVRAVHHDILLFACSELAVSVEHLFEVFLRFLRGGGGGEGLPPMGAPPPPPPPPGLQPLAGPLLAVHLAVDP